MHLIEVRELRKQASQVNRPVRPERAEYVTTYQGRPVAILRLWMPIGRRE